MPLQGKADLSLNRSAIPSHDRKIFLYSVSPSLRSLFSDSLLDRGAGAAIRRARTRWPGGGDNPVAVIRVPPEFLVPGAVYAFEILAIEASGNSTISVGNFVVSE